MSALSDFMGGGGGGFLPHKEFLNVTGTITLDLSKYSAFKVTQGAGDLTLNFIEDDPEIRGEADLFLAKNPAFNLTVNSDAILSISTGEFDLSSSSYKIISFDVSGQDNSPTGLVFNNDGSKMYVTGFASDSVHQYTLSTPFDLSTTSYDSISFGVSGETGTPQGLAFNNDGTKMYVTGTASDSVYQYTSPTVNKVSQFGAFTGIQSEVYLYAI